MVRRAAHLIVVAAGGSTPVSVALDADVTRIGSAPDAEIVLPDPELSATHARIERRDDDWVLVREANPLLVNGMRVRIHVLAPFDTIVLGKNVLSFRSGAAVGPLPAPPTPIRTSLPSENLDAIRRLAAFAARAREGEPAALLAERILDDLIAMTGASRGTLVRLSSDDDPVSLVSSVHGSFTGGDVLVSRTLLAKMRSIGQPIFVENTITEPELASAESLSGEPAMRALAVPVLSEGRVVGAIYLSARTTSRMTKDAVELVQLYATQAVSILEAERERARLTERLDVLGEANDDESLLVGKSEPMRELKKTLRKIATARAPVLVSGETGTGKELVARELHRLSARARGPFVAVNCGAIPHELLASELFGHKRGAFTGAASDRLGFFRSAEGGTLFLDEIGEMPLSQQVALLRVLQEERVVPVGAEQSIAVDVRVVCATNRNLSADVAAGRFREDLFFRLAVVQVLSPPLRDRPGDVLQLAEVFLRRAIRGEDRQAGRDGRELRFSDEALAALLAARWEGNVRELDARVRRAVLMAEQEWISPADLDLGAAPRLSRAPSADLLVRPLSMARDEFLRRYVREVVERFQGNRTAAADALMVSARTVFKYMDE